MIARLISNVLTGVWLIDPAKAEGYYPVLVSLLNGKFKTDEFRPVRKDHKGEDDDYLYYPKQLSGGQKKFRRSWDADFSDIAEDTTFIIPVLDTITKYDYCGAAGSNTISAFIKAASQIENVKGFIFHIDSPGGEADGTRNLAQVIANCGKPTIAWVDGMAASAAYWIASACDEIICNLDTDEVGSIGTYVQFGDFKGWYEKNGIKVHTIYASKSTNKNKSFKDALDGKYDDLRSEIDVVNESFISGVKSKRGAKISDDTAYTGKLYFADKGIASGMIDKIGSFDVALQSLENLSNKIKDKEMNLKEKWNSLKSFFTGGTVTEEGLDAINSRVEELQSENNTLQAGLTETESKLEAATALATVKATEVTAKDEEITTLKAQVADLTSKIPTTKLDNGGDDFEGELSEDEKILNTKLFA